MKKMFITLVIAVVLVAGYFVGNTSLQGGDGSQLYPTSRLAVEEDSIGTKSYSRSNPNNDYSEYSPNQQPNEGNGSYSTNNVDGCTYDECMTVPPVDPSTGNPKGNKIVKTGNIEVSINKGSLGKKYSEVVTLIPGGGFVESSQSTETQSTITLRIPADKLDTTLIELRKLGNVIQESIYSNDRTFESIDYDARLKIMREREVVLVDLLKKATSVNDTESIQNKIFDLRTQIETLQGQKDVLESQVALSTLSVTLTQKGTGAKHRMILAQSWEKAAGVFLTSIGGIMIVFSALFPFIILGIVLIVIARKVINTRKTTTGDTQTSTQ